MFDVYSLCPCPGEPTHRLQYNILLAARALELDVTCSMFPTYIMMTFGSEKGHISLLHYRIHIFTGTFLQVRFCSYQFYKLMFAGTSWFIF